MRRHILSRFWKNTKGRGLLPQLRHISQHHSPATEVISKCLWHQLTTTAELVNDKWEGIWNCWNAQQRRTRETTLDHYTEERVLLRKNTKSSVLKVMICLSVPPLLLHEAIVCWCCGADILVTISLVPTASLHAKILCNTHRNVRGTLLGHNQI